MVDSRLRLDPPSIFHCYLEILNPFAKDEATKFRILYPEDFQDKEEICQQVHKFCYPCETDSCGVQYFAFVLTDIDGKFRYGFCRYPPYASSCSCILSYLPWFEAFYNVLDSITELQRNGETSKVMSFLEILLRHPLPEPASQFSFHLESSSLVFKFDVPDMTKLPSIPENRNLTEYFAAINPENMVYLFVSMMFERRIIVTSKKLSLLTAVIHGSVSLLYPMQWQHIYVPILPPHLIDYCCAPMPFILGIHASMMDRVREMPMNEVVILDADTNEIHMMQEDLDIFPGEVASKLKAKLKRTELALSDYVSSQFLRALVTLIGGYRDALKYTETSEGEKIVFDDEAFLASRSGHMRTFLESILHLQSFRQFVEGRLILLNAGLGFDDLFEEEVSKHGQDSTPAKVQYERWRLKMRKGGDILKKNVSVQLHYLKEKANDIEIKHKMKSAYKGSRSAVKSAYRGLISNIRKEDLSGDESPSGRRRASPKSLVSNFKRNNTAPSHKLALLTPKWDAPHLRHTVHEPRLSGSAIKRGEPVKQNPGKPPPSGSKSHAASRPSAYIEGCGSVDLGRKDYLLPSARYSCAQSEPNIASLLDFDSSSLSSWTPSEGTPEYSSTPEDVDVVGLPSFANPGFHVTPSTSQSFCDLLEEDIQLEYRKISRADSVNRSLPKSTVVDVEKNVSDSRPLWTVSSPSNATPPMSRSRPPPIAKLSLTTKSTVSPRIKGQSENLLEFEPLFFVSEPKSHDMFQLRIAESDYDTAKAVTSDNSRSESPFWTPSGTIQSPFYTPSADLSSLDSSLFHETINLLSAETRQMMSANNRFSPGSVLSSRSPSTNANDVREWTGFGGAEMQGSLKTVTRSELPCNPASTSMSPMVGSAEAKAIASAPFESLLAETKNSLKKTQEK